MDKTAAHAAHVPVGIRGDLDRPILVALLRRIGKMLAAVLDPFHRAAQQCRRGDDRDVLRIDAELGPETAADIGRRDAQPAFVELDIVGEGRAQIVRLLRRSPHRRFAIGDLRQDAAAFHRMRGAAMNPQILVHDMRGLAEGRLDVAVGDFIGDDLVRFQFAAHRGRSRDTAIGRRRQHVIIDRDQCRGVLGDIPVFGQDDGDRFADKRHLAVGQREGPALVEPGAGIRGADHAPPLHDRRELVEREHRGNAGHRAGGAGIDAADQRMRMWAAQEGRMQHAGARDVVDKARAAGQQRMVFKARNARSDQFVQLITRARSA